MEINLLEDLNDNQLKAVRHKDGPCLVVAGAGTGKTTVITRRIAYLIQNEGIDPEHILALTFTDKAAREMEGRVDELLPYGLSRATISTFHSFCADLLKRHAFLLGINPSSKLMSTAEQMSFLRQRLDLLPTKLFKPARQPVDFLNAFISYTSKLKDENISPKNLATYAAQCQKAATDEAETEEADKLAELATIYSVAQQLYRDNDVLSYGDLIYYSVQVLNDYPSARAEEQRRATYLLVDEFQDTNLAQNEVVRLIAGNLANVMAVGDDDQAIYSFRGATLANIMGFTKTFTNTKIYSLVDNYRSTQEVLDVAYRLIQNNNPDRLEIQEHVNKQLLSHQPTGPLPIHLHFKRGYQEYQTIATTIEKLIEDGYEPEDIAILSRARTHTADIENALQNRGIPYQNQADTKFYTIGAIRTAMAYLRFLADPADDLNLFSLLSQPPFSIAELQTLLKDARYRKLSLWERLSEESNDSITFLSEHLPLHTGLASRAYLDFLHSSKWHQELASQNNQDALEQLASLYQEITAFEQSNRDAGVLAFVTHVDYLVATDEEIRLNQEPERLASGVQIMTAHKSKGLEFRAVFVVNLVDGRFPGRSHGESLPFPHELTAGSLHTKEQLLQEERRLAYVAFTRAKERLYLTSSELYEDRKTAAKVSPFILEALGQNSAPEAVAPEGSSLISEPPVLTEPNTPELSMPSSLSPSALETYAKCPTQYQYQFVWNIQVPPNHFANFGTSVHETLREWFTAREKGEQPDLDTIYKAHWIGGGYESRSYEQERYTEGLERLRAYVEKCKECTPVSLELSVKGILPGGQVLHGKIDRVDRLDSGKLRIIDYKTKEKAIRPKELREQIPIAAYALALQQQGKEIESVEMQFVMSGETLTVPVEDMGLPETLARADDLVNQIRTSLAHGSFPAKPSKTNCDYCDYRSICPFRFGN